MGDDSWSAADEIRRLKILAWLADKGEGEHAIQTCFLNERGGWLGNVGVVVRQDLQYLSAYGWIEEKPAWSRDATGDVHPYGTRVQITQAGRSKAGEIREARPMKPAIVAACRTNVLWWLYSQDAVGPSRSLLAESFLLDRHSVYYGRQFTRSELLAAYDWLYRRGLVTGTDPAEQQASLHVYLTDAGVSCIEQHDGEAEQYLEAMKQGQRPPHSQPGPVINIHGGQVQMATGQYSQQTMNVGLAAEQLVLVIQGVAEMLHTLGLNSEQSRTLVQVQQDAMDDVTSERPSGKGVRRFYDWALSCVKQGGSAALTAAVTAAANGMLHDAEQLAHALGG